MSCARLLVSRTALVQRRLPSSLASPTRLARTSFTMASTATASSTALRQRTPATTRSHSGHSGHSGHSHSHGGIDETAHLSSAFTSLRNPSQLDPGSRITLVGLVANVGLTAVKGVAGYLLASSALLADAAHSGSDLVADVVTLVSYRIGRWAPSHRYPYGYGSASLSPPLPPLSFSNEPADSPTFSSQSSNRSGRSSSRSSSLQLQPASVRPRALLVLYRNADSPS